MNLQNILVPIDFSDVCGPVLEHAVAMALKFGGRIVLLHVSEPEPDFVGFESGPQSVRLTTAHDLRDDHRELERCKQHVVTSGVEVVALHIQGQLAAKVLEEADRQAADLIVMGSHGHGAVYNLLVGSVTAGVVKGAKCPVLVVPALRTAAPPAV